MLHQCRASCSVRMAASCTAGESVLALNEPVRCLHFDPQRHGRLRRHVAPADLSTALLVESARGRDTRSRRIRWRCPHVGRSPRRPMAVAHADHVNLIQTGTRQPRTPVSLPPERQRSRGNGWHFHRHRSRDGSPVPVSPFARFRRAGVDPRRQRDELLPHERTPAQTDKVRGRRSQGQRSCGSRLRLGRSRAGHAHWRRRLDRSA